MLVLIDFKSMTKSTNIKLSDFVDRTFRWLLSDLVYATVTQWHNLYINHRSYLNMNTFIFFQLVVFFFFFLWPKYIRLFETDKCQIMKDFGWDSIENVFNLLYYLHFLSNMFVIIILSCCWAIFFLFFSFFFFVIDEMWIKKKKKRENSKTIQFDVHLIRKKKISCFCSLRWLSWSWNPQWFSIETICTCSTRQP